ncbi:MbnP family protein [Flavobacterium psychrotolerans]|uniref:Copper-binding protein MbnP-like domain-containing protein n=1 Tax=Flavobacterium psychrotolerans TaxID=2169410 RepID=A0A2U1JQJ1_9FLAO|nr:MbnP family protein [Flavobacterium psychrotolerans]PWA07163.1 hypothetical protein DB895_00080 [Flavobacterium psychrotolerans]
MKNTFKKIVAVLIVTIVLVSCTKDKDEVSEKGSLKIQFENGFAENGLVLGSPTVATSNNEVLKISKIKFVISTVILTKADGSTFTYPKNQSYFIVDESKPASLQIALSNVPIGDYKKMTIGIGVDKSQYDLGESNQGNLWTQAQAGGMTMTGSWSGGYKCIDFVGTFTSPTVTSDASFMIQNGKSGADYNYTEVSLGLTTNALVRNNSTPQIHMSTDLSQIIDGTNKIDLTSRNHMGMVMIMDGADLLLMTENLSSMFSVEHVHNDPN